jgi:hypothetical protein
MNKGDHSLDEYATMNCKDPLEVSETSCAADDGLQYESFET